MAHPFLERQARPPVEGPFSAEELGLAFRNHSMPLEALRYDVTPPGLHYTLSHFDIPALDEASFRLVVGGQVTSPASFSAAELRALPARTLRVTLECAGNGRAGMSPRYPSMPWSYGGVSTADWTGTPLRMLLARAKPHPSVREIAFLGADRGFDAGVEHEFARSLPLAEAMSDDVLVAWAMNGAPLTPQHGAPVRLVVPGWFGMASVKWLAAIEAREQPFRGYQQAVGYHYRERPGEPGVPVTHARVKSLLQPPGVPDWYTGRRLVENRPVTITGRAWSGAGVPVGRVQFGVDGAWTDAEVEPPKGKYAWQAWRCEWRPSPGEHELTCRATDAKGASQPDRAAWNTGGMGNNGLHRVQVTVRR